MEADKAVAELKKLNTMVSTELNADDELLINTITTIMNKQKIYTLKMAKEVAINAAFIELLVAAMKDTNKSTHKILWEKITPKYIDTSRIKTLAIQDIIKSDNSIGQNIMTKTENGKQKNIPIILGIPNNSNRNKPTFFSTPDTANLCGYLLDYVFSQERNGEEFALLAMYVAVNIDDTCFDHYILDNNENKCNTAFNNIAGILGASVISGNNKDACKSYFETSIMNAYGEKWKEGFNKVISESSEHRDIKKRLDMLKLTNIEKKNALSKTIVTGYNTAKLMSLQTEFDRITYNYNNLPDDIYKNIETLQRYIDVIKILKAKRNYEPNAEQMKVSINDYINDGVQEAFDYIKDTTITNSYINAKIREKEVKEQEAEIYKNVPFAG